MALSTVKAVKQAELNAEKLEQLAKEKAGRVIDNAKEEADNTVESFVKMAREKSDELIKKANSEAGNIMNKAIAEADEQIALYNQSAERKKELIFNTITEIISR